MNTVSIHVEIKTHFNDFFKDEYNLTQNIHSTYVKYLKYYFRRIIHTYFFFLNFKIINNDKFEFIAIDNDVFFFGYWILIYLCLLLLVFVDVISKCVTKIINFYKKKKT